MFPKDSYRQYAAIVKSIYGGDLSVYLLLVIVCIHVRCTFKNFRCQIPLWEESRTLNLLPRPGISERKTLAHRPRIGRRVCELLNFELKLETTPFPILLASSVWMHAWWTTGSAAFSTKQEGIHRYLYLLSTRNRLPTHVERRQY